MRLTPLGQREAWEQESRKEPIQHRDMSFRVFDEWVAEIFTIPGLDFGQDNNIPLHTYTHAHAGQHPGTLIFYVSGRSLCMFAYLTLFSTKVFITMGWLFMKI